MVEGCLLVGFLDWLSGGFCYKNKKGEKWWLHVKIGKNNVPIYYFSKNPLGAVPKPPDYIVVESKTGMPMLKKISKG